MRIRLAVALLATVLSLLIGAPARASGPPMLTMTFNACGNMCRHGEVDLTTSNIAYQIRTRRVAVAMLQELCYSQFLGVRDRLARYGYTGLFATGTKGGHCADYDPKHGRAFGVALIAHGKNAIDRWLTPVAATRPVLFGGDLNSMPDDADLNGFYAAFQEANATRADPLPTFITVPRKIDYLFGSRDYLNRRGASTACGSYSDHCMYFGLFQ